MLHCHLLSGEVHGSGQAAVLTSVDGVDGTLHCNTVIAEVFLLQDSSVVLDLSRRARQRTLRKLGRGSCWPG